MIPGINQLNDLLAGLNAEQGFPISVLTDEQGLAVAWAAVPGMDSERQAAVVAFIQNAASQVALQLGMAETDEISLTDANRQHLVCRPFDVDGRRFILAVMIPGREKSYRRATSLVIQEVRRIWKSFWEAAA